MEAQVSPKKSFRILNSLTKLAVYLTLGNFSKPLATINLPKSPTFSGNFCTGVKIYHFSSEIIFGQLDIWRFLPVTLILNVLINTFIFSYMWWLLVKSTIRAVPWFVRCLIGRRVSNSYVKTYWANVMLPFPCSIQLPLPLPLTVILTYDVMLMINFVHNSDSHTRLGWILCLWVLIDNRNGSHLEGFWRFKADSHALHLTRAAVAEWCHMQKIENFLSQLRQHNCLPQPHTSNAAHVNQPLLTCQKVFKV